MRFDRLPSHFGRHHVLRWNYRQFIAWNDWGVGVSIMVDPGLFNLSFQLGPYFGDFDIRW